MKKAGEVRMLCHGVVGLVILSGAGKLYDLCTPKTAYANCGSRILCEEKHKVLVGSTSVIKYVANPGNVFGTIM